MARKPVDDDEDDDDLDEAPPAAAAGEDDAAPSETGGGDDESMPDFDEDGEEGEAKGGKLKIILISVAALFFVIGAASGAYFFFFAGHDEEEVAEEAEAPDDGTAMAIPTRRRMLTGEELAKQQAEGGGNAAASVPAQSNAGGLTPPPSRTSGGAANPPQASGATPAAAAPAEPGPAANTKGAAKGTKGAAPAASGGSANPQDAGIVTPAVTAVAFRDIPVQPPAKPLGAPDSSYVEVGEYGNMPRAQKGGNGGAWKGFAAPFSGPADKPKIAVIITGLGYSRNATLAAIGQLPPNVTLAFDPYAKGVDEWMGLARSSGHEVLMALPMEPGDFPISDPGPLAMLTDFDGARNVDRLHKIFSSGLGYVGMIQTMGSKFAASEAAMRPVMTELKTRGVLYVSSGAVAEDKGSAIAGELGLPFAAVDLKLDETQTPAAIDAQLTQLEKLSRTDGSGVAVAEATPLTIGKLATWTSSLALKEISLAPVSAMAQIKAAAGGEGKGAPKAAAKH